MYSFDQYCHCDKLLQLTYLSFILKTVKGHNNSRTDQSQTYRTGLLLFKEFYPFDLIDLSQKPLGNLMNWLHIQ